MPSIRESFDQAKAKWAFEGMQHVVGVVREEFLTGQVLKVRTRNLQSRIDSKLLASRDGFEFGTKVDYGVGWELGFTRPAMTIVPQNAKALRFTVGGQTIFRKKANIPSKAFAARPFMRPALEREMPWLQQTADEALGKAVNLALQNRVIKI